MAELRGSNPFDERTETKDDLTMLTRKSIGDGRARAFFRCLEDHLERMKEHPLALDRPYTTLAYAQSLDGSIAATPGRTLHLSNALSRTMTHHLRARHDAILVGINTVLTDNPRLTVRLTAGRHPRPVVIDGCLRMPLGAPPAREPGRRADRGDVRNGLPREGRATAACRRPGDESAIGPGRAP